MYFLIPLEMQKNLLTVFILYTVLLNTPSVEKNVLESLNSSRPIYSVTYTSENINLIKQPSIRNLCSAVKLVDFSSALNTVTYYKKRSERRKKEK